MNIGQFTPAIQIRMTDTAINYTRKEIAKDESSEGIRLTLDTSGCSGYMYQTSLVNREEATKEIKNDQVFKIAEGVTLFINKKHLPILNGTEIDFVTQGLNSMFHFNNPNATAECGCGESFSVI